MAILAQQAQAQQPTPVVVPEVAVEPVAVPEPPVVTPIEPVAVETPVVVAAPRPAVPPPVRLTARNGKTLTTHMAGKNLADVNLGLLHNPKYLPKYHWIPDPPDSRDHPYALNNTVPVVNQVDLRSYCSPIDDQGQLGSCTGNAIAGAIDLIDRRNGRGLRVSRMFIYYQERLLENDVYYDNGAYIRDGIKACYTYGAPLENIWPYDASRWATRPSSAAYSDAQQRKVTGYSRCADFAAVKNALTAGNPVVVGFNVYSSFESNSVAATGIMPYPNTQRETLLGGHAVCLVGFNDAHGWFIARNSWGPNWGDHGYFYMPYQVIQNTAMSSDFWVINSVHNP